MNNLICAESNTGSSIVVYVILIVALVAMLIMPYFTQRKKNKEFMAMLESMKVGDLVKTAGGIIGRIIKISDKGDIKTVILETGSKTEKSYMEFDMSMIYCVLKSSKVEVKEDDESDKEKEIETKVEETVENAPETEKVEEKAEEKVEAKPSETKNTTKSATIKKSTTKKTTSKK